MTDNTTRHLKVEQVLGEWAVVAYTDSTPGAGHSRDDGTVWLRGFASQQEAQGMAGALQRVMDKHALYRAS